MIRPAATSEREALEALQQRASFVDEAYRRDLLDHPDAINLPQVQIDDGSVLVAECKGRLTGFAVVRARDDGDADLDGLFVEPDLWRGGVGRRLIDECVHLARFRGAARLYVVANPQATAFYGKCGFTVVGDAQTRFGPAPMMALDILL
ncbi:MAG: GNAT family N-acetyltransferase [Alphaproteobacteria bacterium]|nr:GNAT family N-acetyltransferase [Alphaproteobacteria bacterium]